MNLKIDYGAFCWGVENNTMQLPKTTKTLLGIKPDTAGLNNKDN